jgi:hypothetical protein
LQHGAAAIERLADVRPSADRDEPLRSKREFLPSKPHGHRTNREIDETLMQIEAILVRTARPARATNFDSTLQIYIQAHTPRQPCVDVKHVALKPVAIAIRHFGAPLLVVKPLVFLSYFAPS